MTGNHRLFYGWWIVAAALGIMFVQAGTGFYSLSVLLKPLMNTFGWSRGVASITQSIYLLISGAGGLLAAKLVEQHGVKKVVTVGAVLGGTCFFLLSFVNNLWYLYILYFFLGIGLGGGAGLVPAALVVANWFDKRRGLAIGITSAGVALGAMILVPSIAFVTERFGFRMTYIFMGIIVFAIIIPLALFVLKTSPHEIGLMPDGDELPEKRDFVTGKSSSAHATTPSGKPGKRITGKLIKSLPLWLLCIGFTLAQIGGMSILVHEVPLITDMGIPLAAAATALGFTGGMGGVGKVVFGWIADKLSTRYVAILCFSLQLVGIVILMQTHTIAMVWLFVVVFGFAMGAMATLMPLAVSDLFGMASFGVIYGLVHFFVIGGSTVGPSFAGFVFDATGSYSIVLSIFAVTYAVAIVAIYFTWGLDPRPLITKRKR